MRLMNHSINRVNFCFQFAQQPQQPGKLNLKNFAIVNDAIARMNVNEGSGGGGGGMSQSTSADTGRGKGGLGAMLMAMTGGGGGGSNAATTGRCKPPPPPVPVSNPSTFANHPTAAYPGIPPLAGGEEHSDDDDGEAEYAQVQEIYPGADGCMGMGGMVGGEQQMYTFSQDTTPNKGNKMRPPAPRGRGPMDKGPPQQQPLGGSKWTRLLL